MKINPLFFFIIIIVFGCNNSNEYSLDGFEKDTVSFASLPKEVQTVYKPIVGNPSYEDADSMKGYPIVCFDKNLKIK
ncbi:MAG: hypothetical protein V2A54_18090, partial [Bacteroidota bacterium]